MYNIESLVLGVSSRWESDFMELQWTTTLRYNIIINLENLWLCYTSKLGIMQMKDYQDNHWYCFKLLSHKGPAIYIKHYQIFHDFSLSSLWRVYTCNVGFSQIWHYPVWCFLWHHAAFFIRSEEGVSFISPYSVQIEKR